MAMAAEFDVDPVSITNLSKRPKIGGKSIVPSPNIRCSWTPRTMSSMWMFADPRAPVPQVVGDRPFFDAVDMAQIYGQSEEWVADALGRARSKRRERVDEHAGLGLEGQGHAARFRRGAARAAGQRPAGPCPLPRRSGRRACPTRGRRTRASRPCARSMALRRKSIRMARRARVGVHQGRVVLDSRVQQVPRPRFHDAGEPATIEARAYLVDLPGEDRRILVRIECAGVKRDGHALVAFVGKQLDGVRQAVVGQAVGVIAKSHDAIWFQAQVE